MIVLGIETSCDECSCALVRDGREILSLVVYSQIPIHQEFQGVIPEIASRSHVQTIAGVYRQALEESGCRSSAIDGIAVSVQPGLGGALQVGLAFAKGLALALGRRFVGVDHILGHQYAAHLEQDIPYPYIGVLVSGGHSLLALVRAADDMEVLGTTIDDAIGEAFDKVARSLGLEYPGGKALDDLARQGDPWAYDFPFPRLYKGGHDFDVSYSGLKNAVINQRDQFRKGNGPDKPADIAASFERVAVEILFRKVCKVLEFTGLDRVVAGGGVAANSYFRQRLAALPGVAVHYPSLALCGDNAAMIAGLGTRLLQKGFSSSWSQGISSRVSRFRQA